MGVKPRNNQIEKETKWDDPVMVELPDLVGMTEKESTNTIYRYMNLMLPELGMRS